ncbi:MAG: EAL domain-containing protein [Desulfobacterales bacterium]|nr:EAL domain-containing protein [Desulfobacterales bacterium]MBF0396398.1 EAL domain-containing protein [Desulfobacterales bacterium]
MFNLNSSDIQEKIKILQEAERKYRSIFENAVYGIFRTTPEGYYLEANPSLARIYGFEHPDIMMRYFRDIKHQLYLEPTRRDDFKLLMDIHGEVFNFESPIRKKDGSIIWISENARAEKNESGEIMYYEGTVVDITERKKIESELNKQQVYYKQLFENTPQAIVLIDNNRNVVEANKSFEKLFGYRAIDIKGFGIRSFIVPDEMMTECESYRKNVLNGNIVKKETLRYSKNKRLIPVLMLAIPVIIDNFVQGIYYIYEDITERKAYEEAIIRKAFYDSLTGLPNRTLFMDRLKRAIERGKRRNDYRFAVIMIDLNKFKLVNDTLGHLAGDRLLINIAKVLESSIRAIDTAARLGGDEFALILEELKDRSELLAIVERIQCLMQKPINIGCKDIVSSGSIGIVWKTQEYKNPEEILRDADIAMYKAKEQAESYIFFNSYMQREIAEKTAIETDLREALNKNEFKLHYQPIISLNSGLLDGFEALLRWYHPIRGIIPPVKFIPLAEETGLIIPIGNWVLKEACKQLKYWDGLYAKDDFLSISVNVSCKQFMQSNFIEQVKDILNQTSINPNRLWLEITESVIINDYTVVINTMKCLKNMGIRLSIDDFGTGYSSLNYLCELPVDCLKIDRSFISNQKELSNNLHIVKTIINMAKTLGLKVVAEGVEDISQLTDLKKNQCDKAQGYYFSKPLDVESAGILIAKMVTSNQFNQNI